MLSLWSLGFFCLLFSFLRSNKSNEETSWPLFNSPSINVLGIFPEISNTSEPSTLMSIHSQLMFKSAIILSHRYNLTIKGEYLGWQIFQSRGDAMDTLSNTCQLISNSNILGIIGPSLSRESHIIAPFAGKLGIPVIAYASTDPELSDRNAYSTFYRTVPSDNAAALAIVQLFLKFNWTSCVIIYQNDAFGSGGSKAITESFNEHNLIIIETIVFDISTKTIRGDLKSLLISSPTRIVLLWSEIDYTKLILEHALDCDVIGPAFLWILTSSIPLNSFNKTSMENLIGIITVEPVVGNIVNAEINQTLLDAAYQVWKEYQPDTFPGADKVDNYALFAFDATWLFIQSFQELCSTIINNSSSCLLSLNTSFCFNRRFLHHRSLANIINEMKTLGVSGLLRFNRNVTDRIDGYYYIARNIQKSSNLFNYIPVLIYSDFDHWRSHSQRNAIVWPGNTLNVPSGYASLKGITLRIAVIESPPFTMIREVKDQFDKTRKETVGYMPDLIEYLRDRMDFHSDIILLPSNVTYHQLIDDLVNGIYDMIVGDITVTSARREKVAFSTVIYDNSLRIVLREDSIHNIDFLSYLRPFSLQLWVTLLGASIYAALLICLLEGKSNPALKEKSIISLIGMSMWYSTGTILGFGADFHLRTAPGRLLTIALYLLSLVLFAGYTAKLASDLTISKSKGIISGVDDIKNGKILYSRIGILINSSIEDYYLREISQGSRNFYPLKSDEDMSDKLLNNIIDASIWDSGVLEYMTTHVFCNLTLIGSDFGRSTFAIAFQKNWLYEQQLDIHLISLRERGVLDQLKRKWFENNLCSKTFDVTDAMNVQSMAGLFLTFGLISILAVLLFLWTKKLSIKNYFFRLIHRISCFSSRRNDIKS
jgi:ABC-type amino acid transport substrate-binding protein/ABC-type branched-subunit amino acid transport system substrate-binding protein